VSIRLDPWAVPVPQHRTHRVGSAAAVCGNGELPLLQPKLQRPNNPLPLARSGEIPLLLGHSPHWNMITIKY